MNCEANQLAWIAVPCTPMNAAMGLDLINGRVVKTVQLLPDGEAGEPTWRIDPPQVAKTQAGFVEVRHGFVPAGSVMRCWALPDAWLRPFKDFPPEEIEQLQRELTT